ncbi:MAG: hypothetical protein QW590_00090 [Candidatus Bilamarchaeaceae archaeon]
MERVYEVQQAKKGELKKILEADPYAQDSFARIGYRMRDGASLGESKDVIYVYLSAQPDFIKKADERLKEIAQPLTGEKEKRVIEKIKSEEESAESGLGSIFG